MCSHNLSTCLLVNIDCLYLEYLNIHGPHRLVEIHCIIFLFVRHIKKQAYLLRKILDYIDIHKILANWHSTYLHNSYSFLLILRIH